MHVEDGGPDHGSPGVSGSTTREQVQGDRQRKTDGDRFTEEGEAEERQNQ